MAKQGNKEAVEMLLAAKADPTLKNKDGRTAISFGASAAARLHWTLRTRR